MEIQDLQIVIPAASAATALAGVAGAWFKAKKDIKAEIAKDIQALKDHYKAEHEKVDLRLDAVRNEILGLEKKVERDIEHVRMTYNSEVRNLTEKVEGLREEVRQHHGQLLGLLAKLVSSED
jgi:polyhydroxyalkanoate synthesis regulator phasin